jgi:hypothetical protein
MILTLNYLLRCRNGTSVHQKVRAPRSNTPVWCLIMGCFAVFAPSPPIKPALDVMWQGFRVLLRRFIHGHTAGLFGEGVPPGLGLTCCLL